MSKPREILFEGYTPEALLQLPDEQFAAFVFTDEALLFRVGSAIILGRIRVSDRRLIVELAHIDGGGEGVLPALWRHTERYARQHGLAEVEWVVHALTCAEPNRKLLQVLERRGFVVEEVPGFGLAYHYRHTLSSPGTPGQDPTQ